MPLWRAESRHKAFQIIPKVIIGGQNRTGISPLPKPFNFEFFHYPDDRDAEPIFLTKNGEGDLVVMDIETYNRREKMLKLREELLAVEEDRLAGRMGCTLEELDSYLDDIIDEV